MLKIIDIRVYYSIYMGDVYLWVHGGGEGKFHLGIAIARFGGQSTLVTKYIKRGSGGERSFINNRLVTEGR